MIRINSEKYLSFTWRCNCGYVSFEKMFEREFERKKSTFKVLRNCKKCGKPLLALKKTFNVNIKR